MATLTLVHQPEAVEALERRLREEILTANLSRTPVASADGRFTVIKVLGHGASSVVCKAHETELDRPIALKLFPGLADDSLARAVKREAQNLAKISHPNIVTVHGIGVLKLTPGDHRCFFVAMELGVPLKEWLTATPRSQDAILATFCRIGEGLAAIHEAKLVYRDLKPENVVIVAGAPKIVDFGLAVSAATGNDPSGPARVVGTPAFMAPEALRGQHQDPRSDQFSFAAALWKALCGELPYDRFNQDPAARGPVHAPKVALPERVEQALRKALDPQPSRRFTDMPALLAALQPVEPPRGSSATGRVATLGVDFDSTTDLVPVRSSPRRTAKSWLMLPAVGALSIGGVLTAMGFWDSSEADEAPIDDIPAEEESIPPPPSPPAPPCPNADAVVGGWRFSANAQWAERAPLLGKIGQYTLDIMRDGTPCGLQVDLRKLGNDNIVYNEPRTDRQRVQLVPAPPFTGGFAGRFAPVRAGQAAADNSYDFAFIVDGDALYGDFHALTDAGRRFSGDLHGVRAAVTDPPADRSPCIARCGADCLGTDATSECRQACAGDAWAELPCPAPDPAEKIALPSKTSECPDARLYSGKWLFLASDRKSRTHRAYEVELRADKCDITVVSARERYSGDTLRGEGRAHLSGLWEVNLTGGQVRHTLSLVGRDPAFGEFTARRGEEPFEAGVVAAYRRP